MVLIRNWNLRWFEALEPSPTSAPSRRSAMSATRSHKTESSTMRGILSVRYSPADSPVHCLRPSSMRSCWLPQPACWRRTSRRFSWSSSDILAPCWAQWQGFARSNRPGCSWRDTARPAWKKRNLSSLNFQKNFSLLLFEEFRRLWGRSEECRAALSDQHDLVEHSEQLRAGLMDGDDDRLAFVRQSLQHLQYRVRHKGVQSRCRFIAQQQVRIGQSFRCERQSLPFATRQSFDPTGAADDGVGALAQTQLDDDFVDADELLSVRNVSSHPQHRLEDQMFLGRQRRDEQIVLLDVRALRAELLGVHRNAI